MPASDTLLAALPNTPSAGIRTMARLGFAAIGVVHLLMGVLALLAATGLQQGAHTDKREAVQHLQDLPGGRVLLGLMAVGLVGYIIWRFTQAIIDTESKGSGAKGLGTRPWYVISGLFYSSLALYAGRLALHGQAQPDGSDTSRTLTATVLSWPGGDWLVMLAGGVIIGAGLFQVYRAYSGQFQKDVNASRLPAGQQRLVYRTGQIGFTSRGIVLGLIGYFFVQAGLQSRAGAVGSTDEAFDLLATTSPAMLGVVAAGLVAFGLHMLVQAKYPVLRGI